MPLHHSFEVASPADAVFAALWDLDRALPCVPGLRLAAGDSGAGGGDAARAGLTLRDGGRSLAYELAVVREHADADRRSLRLTATCGPTDPPDAPSFEVQVDAAVAAVDDRRSRVDLHLAADGAVDHTPARAVARRVLEQFSRNLEVVVVPVVAGASSREPSADAALPGPAASTQRPAGTEGKPDRDTGGGTSGSVTTPWLPIAAAAVIGLVIVWWLHRRSASTAPR